MQKSLILLFLMLLSVEVMAFSDPDSDELSSNSSPISPFYLSSPNGNEENATDQARTSIQDVEAMQIDADFIQRYGQGIVCDEATVDQSVPLPLHNIDFSLDLLSKELRDFKTVTFGFSLISSGFANQGKLFLESVANDTTSHPPIRILALCGLLIDYSLIQNRTEDVNGSINTYQE